MGVRPAGIALISTRAPLGSEVMVTTPSFDRPFGDATVVPGFNFDWAAGGPGTGPAFGLNPASNRAPEITSTIILGGSGIILSWTGLVADTDLGGTNSRLRALGDRTKGARGSLPAEECLGS